MGVGVTSLTLDVTFEKMIHNCFKAPEPKKKVHSGLWRGKENTKNSSKARAGLIFISRNLNWGKSDLETEYNVPDRQTWRLLPRGPRGRGDSSDLLPAPQDPRSRRPEAGV